VKQARARWRGAPSVGETTQQRLEQRRIGQFFWLLVSEMLVLRVHWLWYLVQMSINPLVFMVFLGFFWATDTRSIVYVATGTAALALMTSSMLSLGQEIGYLKETQAYEHYAVLPISKLAFILALATKGMLLALPSAFITLLVASQVFSLHLSFSPATLLVMVLAGYSLAGLGAVIGFYSPNARVASLVTQLILPPMVYFAPVFVPAEKLPRIVASISVVMPTTYVASALRAVLRRSLDPHALFDIVVLLTITVVSLLVASAKVDWRANDAGRVK